MVGFAKMCDGIVRCSFSSRSEREKQAELRMEADHQAKQGGIAVEFAGVRPTSFGVKELELGLGVHAPLFAAVWFGEWAPFALSKTPQAPVLICAKTVRMRQFTKQTR